MIEPTAEFVETIEFDDETPAEPEPTAPEYHTLLEVWRAVLAPARPDGELRDDPISPQWATRIVSSYHGVGYADTPAVNTLLLELVDDLADLLDAEIDSDDQCLTRTEAELDAVENAEHYRNLLMVWQAYFLRRELAWDTTAPDAAIQIAALSECHKMFFGSNGLTSHLDSIKFEFTEEHQEELRVALEETRQAGIAALKGARGA